MRALVADAQPGDRFVFHCMWCFVVLGCIVPYEQFVVSGHGSQVPNEDGTEEDGLDEGISRVNSSFACYSHRHTVLWPVDVQYNPNDGSQADYILDDVCHTKITMHFRTILTTSYRMSETYL